MAKIVINECHGGFSLSHAAIMRYAELKGITLYPEAHQTFRTKTYWTVAPETRDPVLEGDAFYHASIEERRASNMAYERQRLYDRNIPRSDPALVRVVEELGEAANGRYARLAVEDVPAGAHYRITEYDGFESIELRDEIAWDVA